MGDEQRLSPDEQIRSAREAFDEAQDFTLAVEEEFAILDPETLSLANRFEELQAAAKETALEPHLVGREMPRSRDPHRRAGLTEAQRMVEREL